MEDLVQWLGAQLDEDERIARACAGNGEWDAASIAIYGAELAPEVREHMAEHDPARALREIAVDRELRREYAQLLDAYAWHKRAQSELASDIEQENRTGRWSGPGDAATRQQTLRREADYLPAMIRVLEKWAKGKAAIYADRPGYKEAWRP